MTASSQPQILQLVDGEDRPDLDRLLDAWSTATERLQATHEALREQVRRLSDELEIKNWELARKNRLEIIEMIEAERIDTSPFCAV